MESHHAGGRPMTGLERRAGRVRRLLGRAAVAGVVVVAVAVVVPHLVPHGENPQGPAPTSESVAPPGPSADGLLLTWDLGREGVWRRTGPDQSGTSFDAPICGRSSSAERTLTVSGRRTARTYTWVVGYPWVGDITETVVRLSPDSALRLAEKLRPGPSCTVSGGVALSDSTDVVVSGAPIAGAAGAIGRQTFVALRGTTLVQLVASFTRDGTVVAAPGGAQWLIAIGVIAIDRATGVRIPTPAANAASHAADDADGSAGSGPLPAGFLQVGELDGGAAWAVRDGDRMASAVLGLDLPACQGETQPQITGKGTVQIYQGWIGGTPQADLRNEWLLEEGLVTLSPSAATRLRTALAHLRTCTLATTRYGRPRPVTVTGPKGATVLAITLADGTPGQTFGWVLDGTRVVRLTTLPGGPHGGVALPGGVAWFTTALQRAVTRAASS